MLPTILVFMLLAACQPNDDTGMMDNQPNDQGQNQIGQQDGQFGQPGQMNVNDRGTSNRTGDRMGDNTGNRLGEDDRADRMGDNTGWTDRTAGNDRYDIAEEAADAVTDQVDDVRRAYVLTGDDNAYVAVVLHNDDNNTEDLSDDLKEEVADVVKSTKRDLNNVYVSANPDFVNMTGDYVDRVGQGDPVEGFFEEFTQMLDRVFPDLEG